MQLLLVMMIIMSRMMMMMRMRMMRMRMRMKMIELKNTFCRSSLRADCQQSLHFLIMMRSKKKMMMIE